MKTLSLVREECHVQGCVLMTNLYVRCPSVSQLARRRSADRRVNKLRWEYQIKNFHWWAKLTTQSETFYDSTKVNLDISFPMTPMSVQNSSSIKIISLVMSFCTKFLISIIPSSEILLRLFNFHLHPPFSFTIYTIITWANTPVSQKQTSFIDFM